MDIKAKVFRFNEDGASVGKSRFVKCYFPSSSKPLTLNISLDYDKKTGVSTEIELKIVDIFQMVFGRAMENIFKDKP